MEAARPVRWVRTALAAAGLAGHPGNDAGPWCHERLAHLDALRGLAALVVVVHHAWLAMPGSAAAPAAWSAVNIVVLGRPAVILFFALSGFVLTLHLAAAAGGYAAFLVRRLVRLLVPYAAAIGLAAAAFALTLPHRPTGLSGWFDAQWSEEIGPGDVLRHLALLAGPRQFPLDHVAWSLVHEIRLSLMLPLFLAFRQRLGSKVALAAAAGFTAAADAAVSLWPGTYPAGIHGLRFDAEGFGPSLVLTARFTLAFALGALLATHRTAARRALCHPAVGVLLPLPALALLSCRNETVMAVGAAGLVAAAAWARPLIALLRARPLVWLGRISFSLYLVHLPVMLACMFALKGCVPARAALLLGLGSAFPVAIAMMRLVEEPAIDWSRSAARFVSAALSSSGVTAASPVDGLPSAAPPT